VSAAHQASLRRGAVVCCTDLRALVRAVLMGNVATDFAVVFHRSPDADMDCGQHGSFGDHCRTSAYVVSNISGVMLRLKLCCVEGDHKLSYWSGGILLAT